jgi:hypothetical protein
MMKHFQIDKILHLSIGMFVATNTYFLSQSLYLTWGAVLIAGAGKEWYDSTGRGHVEFRDFLATIIPAGLPTIWHLWQ